MSLSIEEIASLPVPLLRKGLVPWVTSHVAAASEARAALESTLQAQVDATSDDDFASLLHAFATAGAEYRHYPAVPPARTLTRAYMAAMTPAWRAEGLDRLDAWLASGPARRMLV